MPWAERRGGAGRDGTGRGLADTHVAPCSLLRPLAPLDNHFQDAITEGAPPVKPDNVYDVGEQAYCLDKHGHWWPAIVESEENGM